MKLYKLTDANGQTYNGTQWGEGITRRAKSGKGELCSEYYIHAYTHPLLAVFFNPIHAQFKNSRLWEAKGRIAKRDHGLKIGCKSLTTICEIPCPKIMQTQYIRFGILGAMEVCEDNGFIVWAKQWLDGKDRNMLTAHSMSVKLSQPGTAKELSPGHLLFKKLLASEQSAVCATRAAAGRKWWDLIENYAARYAAAAVAYAACIADIDLVTIAEEAMKDQKEGQ